MIRLRRVDRKDHYLTPYSIAIGRNTQIWDGNDNFGIPLAFKVQENQDANNLSHNNIRTLTSPLVYYYSIMCMK